MQFSYLVTWVHADPAARITATDLERIAAIVEATPALRRSRLYTPESADDYYTQDGPSPIFALQLDYDTVFDLEAPIAAGGHLQALAAAGLASLAGCRVEQQAMLRRPFPVADANACVPAGSLPCQFLVHYPGHAHDFDAWINYYLTHHPQIMFDFPGVREIEIFTCIDWLDAMPFTRVHYMQRNKLMFDSAQAITEAMHSPVRHAMRQDFERFPPFEGSNIHHPMAARTTVFD
ncbi:EthD family reductase [Paraburkholderia youngii]|uniref:EthD family reductase n=1 Tax=Paraburkholderia youngii TaxID=2782701 RepID=UPI003D1D729E